MALPIIPIVIGVAGGVLLLLRKDASAQQQKPPPKKDALVTKPPSKPVKTQQQVLEEDIYKVVGAGVGLAAAGVSAIGTVATVAGVAASTVAGYVTAIAIIVVVTVILSVRGAQDAQWVSDSLRKGQNGLIDDMSTLFGNIGRKMVEGGRFNYDNAHSYVFGMAKGYNDCMSRMVTTIPWGNAFVGWEQHMRYWADRAMFVQPENVKSLGDAIATKMGMAKEPVPSKAYSDEGYALGIILIEWMFGTYNTIEPWHYDWARKSVTGSGFVEFGSFGIDTAAEGHMNYTGAGTVWALCKLFDHAGVMNPALASMIGDMTINGGTVWSNNSAGSESSENPILQRVGPFVFNWTMSGPKALVVTGGMEFNKAQKTIEALPDKLDFSSSNIQQYTEGDATL